MGFYFNLKNKYYIEDHKIAQNRVPQQLTFFPGKNTTQLGSLSVSVSRLLLCNRTRTDLDKAKMAPFRLIAPPPWRIPYIRK